MAFTLDQKQHNRAVGMGALQGGVAGAATGATVGTAGGPVGIAVGALIGGAIGAAGGGGAAGLQDKQAQMDVYDAKMADLAAKQSAEADMAAISRDQAALSQKAPSAALQYMGSGTSATGLSSGGTSYDRWKAGGY